MNKAVLRKVYLDKRKWLDQEALKLKNEQILKNLFQLLDFSSYHTVHTFLPIQKNNEVNIWPILAHIRKHYKHIKIVISKSDFNTFEMQHYVYKEDTILIENQFGIPEPEHGEIFPNDNFDIIFVPLVVFDLLGHRIGYGKGFYDRFLSKSSGSTLKVGLSLFEPIQEIPDIHENDIILDHCITPEQSFSFPHEH